MTVIVPDLGVHARRSGWHLNTDGVWTWYPPPARRYVNGAADETFRGLRRPCLAVHEAGHAVAALAGGMGVDGAYLSPVPGAEQTTAAHVMTRTPAGTSWRAYAVKKAAGERAADRWLRETRQWSPQRAWAVERGARADRESAVRDAPQYGAALRLVSHPRGGWTEVCTWADEVLNAHWHRVNAVARALLANGALDAAGIARLAGLPNPSVEWMRAGR